MSKRRFSHQDATLPYVAEDTNDYLLPTIAAQRSNEAAYDWASSDGPLSPAYAMVDSPEVGPVYGRASSGPLYSQATGGPMYSQAAAGPMYNQAAAGPMHSRTSVKDHFLDEAITQFYPLARRRRSSKPSTDTWNVTTSLSPQGRPRTIYREEDIAGLYDARTVPSNAVWTHESSPRPVLFSEHVLDSPHLYATISPAGNSITSAIREEHVAARERKRKGSPDKFTIDDDITSETIGVVQAAPTTNIAGTSVGSSTDASGDVTSRVVISGIDPSASTSEPMTTIAGAVSAEAHIEETIAKSRIVVGAGVGSSDDGLDNVPPRTVVGGIDSSVSTSEPTVAMNGVVTTSSNTTSVPETLPPGSNEILLSGRPVSRPDIAAAINRRGSKISLPGTLLSTSSDRPGSRERTANAAYRLLGTVSAQGSNASLFEV